MTTASRTRCSVSLNTIAFPGLSGEATQARMRPVILDTGDEAQGTMSEITGGRDRGHRLLTVSYFPLCWWGNPNRRGSFWGKESMSGAPLPLPVC